MNTKKSSKHLNLNKTGSKIQTEIKNIFVRAIKIFTLSIFSWVILAIITLILLWLFVSKAYTERQSESTSAMRKYIYLKIAKYFDKPVVLHFHAFSPETTTESTVAAIALEEYIGSVTIRKIMKNAMFIM